MKSTLDKKASLLLEYLNLKFQVTACSRVHVHSGAPAHSGAHTVNIYRYKTIEANGNIGVIPTTSKSFSLYVPGIA